MSRSSSAQRCSINTKKLNTLEMKLDLRCHGGRQCCGVPAASVYSHHVSS
jgi:hypothetical protein